MSFFPAKSCFRVAADRAKRSCNVNAIPGLSPGTENGRAGRNLAGNDDVCRDLRGRGNVAACELDFVAAGQGQQAAQKAVYPGLRQIGGKPQRQKAGQRFAAHGGNVAQAARKAAVSYGSWRVPGSPEMYVFNAEIGSDQKLKSRL